jgi:hypothetical protein
MNELRHSIAVAAIAGVGFATLLLASNGGPLGLPFPVDHPFVTAVLGAALLTTLAVPPVRLPTVVAGALGKGALAGVLLVAGKDMPGQALVEGMMGLMLAGAGALLAYEAWQEARWDRGSPLRQG